MPENILVVNMNYLGDALLTTPALADLRRAYPDARIDTLVGAGAAAVLHANPDINTVISRRAKAGLARLWELYALLRAGRYTTAIFLPPIPGYAIAAFLARTPRRVGQGTRQMSPFLTDRRPIRAAHLADRMRETMPVPDAVLAAPSPLVLPLLPAAVQAADALLAAHNIAPDTPFLAVNVGATRPQKRWQARAFAETLDQTPSLPAVLLGAGVGDDTLAREVLSMTRRTDVVSLVGQTDVQALAALLARSAVLLSADSGPMHIAAAVGTPTVALFGSTSSALTGPYDSRSLVLDARLSCAPCGKHPTCDGRWDCMRALHPADAAAAVQGLLRTLHPPARPLTLLPTKGSA